MTFLKKPKKLILTASAVVVLDQVSKMLLSHSGSINSGISFSLLSTLPRWMLITMLLVVLIGVWQWGKQTWQKHPLAAGLFFGGAISNLFDRIMFGGVRDFLPVPIIGVENNLADYFLTIGLFLLLYGEIFND